MTDETVKKPRACGMCGLELQPIQKHLSLQHCVRDMRERIVFLRQITLNQAKEVDWERTAIKATHRIAHVLLSRLTKKGRVTVPREAFETIPEGAAIAMSESEDGTTFEIVAVKAEETKPAEVA